MDISHPDPTLDAIPIGMTPVFSPRTRLSHSTYVSLLDKAKDLACITFAFTVPDVFKTALQDNTSSGPLLFMLLE